MRSPTFAWEQGAGSEDSADERMVFTFMMCRQRRPSWLFLMCSGKGFETLGSACFVQLGCACHLPLVFFLPRIEITSLSLACRKHRIITCYVHAHQYNYCVCVELQCLDIHKCMFE